MQFPTFHIALSSDGRDQFILNKEMIDRLEKDISSQNLCIVKIFLEKLNFNVPTFDSLNSYERFIRLLKKDNNVIKNDVRANLINAFKNKFGLPFFGFDCDLSLIDITKTKNYGCSREIMESYSPWFKTILTSGLLESQTQSIALPLSQEGIEFLLQYIYTTTTAACSISVIREVYQFAESIFDEVLSSHLRSLLFKSYLQDKNDAHFDAEFVTQLEENYFEDYLKNKKIEFVREKNKKYSISLKNFNIIFQKQSKINDFIIEEIDTLSIRPHTEMLRSFLIKKRYRKKITNLTFEYKPSFQEFHEMINIFDNFYQSISFYEKMKKDTHLSPKSHTHNKKVNYLMEWINSHSSCDFAYAWLYDFYFENKLYQEAEIYIRRAIGINPFKHIYLLNLCNILSFKKEWKEFEFYAKKALTLNPPEETTEKIYETIGKLNWETNPEEAQIYLNKTLKLNFNNLYAHLFLGNINARNKKWQEAEIHFLKVCEINPQISIKKNLVACQIANYLHKIEEIKIKAKFKSYEIECGFNYDWEFVFYMNTETADLNRLLFLYEQIKQALKFDENEKCLNFFMICLCLKLKKDDEVEIYIKRLNLPPVEYLKLMYVNLVKLQKYDTLKNNLLEIMKIKPEEEDVHLVCVEELIKANQLDLALSLLLEVIKIHPNSDIVNEKIGEIYFVMEKDTEALKYFELALAINPMLTYASDCLEEIKSTRNKAFWT